MSDYILNITRSRRAGDADRDEMIAHLSWCLEHGYLDAAEFSARRDRALEAEEQNHLVALVDDLPSMPEPRKVKRPLVTAEAKYATIHAVAAIASLAVAIIPMVVLASASHGIGNAGPAWLALGIFSIIAGAISFTANLFSMRAEE